jgi:myo-inositol-1(or 4)-monophosphatase
MQHEPDPGSLFAVARTSALEAGAYLAEHTLKSTVLSADGRDVKLDVDRGAETLIVKSLREATSYPILTEEAGWLGPSAPEAGFRWIVDPLDGTMNFLRGIPLCCVSIALWKGGQPVLGVIYNFNDDELFMGEVGKGAWLRDRPIHVSQNSQLDQSILFSGFPVGTDFSTEALNDFVSQIRRYKKIRAIGSAALALAYVAAGRGDLYYERDVKIWDVAAGLAIVQAAGGKITVEESSKPHSVTAYGGNAHLDHSLS